MYGYGSAFYPFPYMTNTQQNPWDSTLSQIPVNSFIQPFSMVNAYLQNPGAVLNQMSSGFGGMQTFQQPTQPQGYFAGGYQPQFGQQAAYNQMYGQQQMYGQPM